MKFTSRAKSAPVAEKSAAPLGHQSLGLAQVLEHLERRERPVVLDLGPANGANIAFLSQYGCKVFVEHLAASLDELTIPDPESGESRPDVRQILQKFNPDTRFDAIFAWDLFNYIDAGVLAELIECLSQHCSDDTLLFASVCGGKSISTEPMVFEFQDSDHLRYRANTEDQIPCPGFSQLDFRNKFPDLGVVRTYLLRNGMQEYVFRFGGN